MNRPDDPVDAVPDETFSRVFDLHETRTDGTRVFYYGEALAPKRHVLRELWPQFHEAGYEIQFVEAGARGDVLVVEPVTDGIDGIPWLNVGLLLATILSTLLVGATTWYYITPMELYEQPLRLLEAWPFTAAVLGVLLTHELGHYALARYHGVSVSLPYVIPFVFPFGTMGAVIRMRGQMPSRKALFDVGAAGPIAGLVATLVVTVVGLSMDPMRLPDAVLGATGRTIVFHNPPLMELVASLIGQPISYSAPSAAVAARANSVPLNPLGDALLSIVGEPPSVDAPGFTVHPVIIGAWVGMFFTVLNLLPVGQFDGGHILRAMLGHRQATVSALVPLALFGLAAHLHFGLGLGLNESVGLWAFWGVFASVIAYNGSAEPIDETPLAWPRQLVGVATFLLGALCFLLVPVQLIAP